MRKKFLLFTIFFGLLFTLAACTTDTDDEEDIVDDNDQEDVIDDNQDDDDEAEDAVTETIIEVATDNGNFTTLLTALDEADLTSTLDSEGSYTVFAPTDDAFADLLTALDIDAATLLDVENLTDILLFHVLDGAYYASDVVSNAPFTMTTLSGDDVLFTVTDGNAFINDVQIVTTDIPTSNGVIHVIEEVILPLDTIAGTAEANGNFNTLIAALDEADLESTLDSPGSYTVFAPTDDAFVDLLTALDIDAGTLLGVENLSDILLYHVLDGAYYSGDVVSDAPFSLSSLQGDDLDFTVEDGQAYINGVEIILTDILTTNGVIHVIEEVILPLDTIAGTADANGNFTTLLTALDEADLATTLDSEGSYTVFAPTDDAFADLLAALDIDAATLLAREDLSEILLYHVFDAAYYSGDVVSNAPFSLETLEGTNATFTVADGMAYINDVQIVTTDILTTNGVIHVIDDVLLPLDTIAGTAEASGNFTTLLAALEAAELDATLDSEGSYTVFAPTDDAFNDLLAALEIDAETLLAMDNLSDILLYHVLDDAYYASDVLNNVPFRMTALDGNDVVFTAQDGSVFINNVEIVTTNVFTSNGVIHVIEDVIFPLDTIAGTAEANGDFMTLLAALEAADLTETLDSEGSFTVFAPTDDAFNDLLTALNIDAGTLLGVENLSDILLYHVLDGAYYASDVVSNAPFSLSTLEGSDVSFTVDDGIAYINDAAIITTDIVTSNGVIHVIEEVILPLDTIAGTAEANGSFTTLLAALEAADLAETLDSEGSFTAFAPTDDAFADLLADLEIDAETLLAMDNLSDILLYHVLDGAYYSTDVVTNAPFSLTTLEGSDVNFTVVDDVAYINDSTIVTTDILTSNGVIHVIDEVLLLP